jgi:hypothetical protein
MRRACLIAVVAASLAFASQASAAAPRYIMFSSAVLPHPVLLDDWRENIDFLLAIQHAPRVRATQLRHRPRFLVSYFWSSIIWTEPPQSPDGATQHGWFYPAFGVRAAAFELERSAYAYNGLEPRRATASFLAILVRHHIPTHCSIRTSLACN